MLSINFSELIWTIINFFLLLFLLKKFLYNPVTNFMADRQARIDAGAQAQKQVSDAMDESRQQTEKALGESRTEAGRLADAAYAEGEKAKDEAMRQCRLQAEQEQDKLRADFEASAAARAHELESKAPLLAQKLADTLLNKGLAGTTYSRKEG